MNAGLDGPVISTFVDDIKIMTLKRSEVIDRIKSKLAWAISIIYMGPIGFLLGLKVKYN